MQDNHSPTPIKVSIADNLSVQLVPDKKHEFLMSTQQAADAYGVTIKAIGHQKRRHEFVEGVHFLTAPKRGSGATPNLGNMILWTKRGIVRLGFFIQSQQAEQVRTWAEDALIEKLEKQPTQQLSLALPVEKPKPLPVKTVTPQYDRDLVEILVKMEDAKMRTRLFTKLKKGGLL